jgi:crotonobetainyl-CoA:carnitine CoA-transferase CaiB-like acyl-CoA transferase
MMDPMTNANDARAPLSGALTIVDLGSGIAAGYCTKLLVDGGADVIKVEPPGGDPLRRRRLLDDGEPDAQAGSRLFRFLHRSCASVVADPHEERDVELVRGLVAGADAVLWSPGSAIAELEQFRPHALRDLAPNAIVATITPFGLVNEPSPVVNQFVLQAMAGGWCGRGTADREPLAVGGEFGDWILGLFGAVGLLTAHQRRWSSGRGELVDVASLDALHLTQTMFSPTFFAASGRPLRARRIRTIPLIHPTTDGFVGFQITTGQQWQDFCALLGRSDWAEDPTLTRFDARIARYDEVNTVIDDWTSQRTTDEVTELAALFRLPVAPVADGRTIRELEQVVERGWFVRDDEGFEQPVAPYTFHGSACPRPFGPAPTRGADTERVRREPPSPRPSSPVGQAPELPFDGLRIADFTAFWAGPIITHYFAMMGADVIHVESTKRPDGIRAATLQFDMSDGWWEASPTFAGTNTNKRDLTLDMGTERGRELALALVARCDIVVDNYSTRVMPHWGLDYEALRAVKPDIIVVRAPGFGLTGPWSERVAYATTIEQACGAAAVTGYEDDRPDVAGGAMDPVAGTHAVFAILLALEHRRRTGEGLLVEVPQFTSGMNVFAEPAIEHSATGRLLGRMGNRSWTAAPQGAYRVRDEHHDVPGLPDDEWIALSVETDDQWRALCDAIGAHDLADDPRLASVDGRRAAHDEIDARIAAWARPLGGSDAVEALRGAGVPAARFAQLHELTHLPEVGRRGLYEDVDTPAWGKVPIVGHPVQFEHGPRRVHRRRAPLLGEHNRDVLEGLLGVAPDEVDRLEADGIIGTQAVTMSAW